MSVESSLAGSFLWACGYWWIPPPLVTLHSKSHKGLLVRGSEVAFAWACPSGASMSLDAVMLLCGRCLCVWCAADCKVICVCVCACVYKYIYVCAGVCLTMERACRVWPWRVTSGLCGGRGGGGGEWGGRWQHGSSSAGGSSAVPHAPPGAVPLGVGGVPRYLPSAGGECCWESRGEKEDDRRLWQPGRTRLPSLSPFAPALTRHCRAGGQPRRAHPKVWSLLWLTTCLYTQPPSHPSYPRALVRCAMTSPPLSFIAELEWPRPALYLNNSLGTTKRAFLSIQVLYLRHTYIYLYTLDVDSLIFLPFCFFWPLWLGFPNLNLITEADLLTNFHGKQNKNITSKSG